jgi:GCN5-like protein 1 (GCN5L1)
MKEARASKVIKEAWIGQSSRYEMANQAATRLETELNLVPKSVESPLKAKMAEIHENKRRISRQTEKLEEKTFVVSKITREYKNLFKATDNRIKEVGDVQNWAELVDQDIRVLERVVQLKGQR